MTRPKKIVRIIARLNVGGPAIHTVLLSNELEKRGYENILVCGKTSDSEGDMMYFARDNNVAPVIIPDLGREISLIKDIKTFVALFSLLKREKPDIVHTHTAKAGALGRLAALCAGVPIRVHTFHGHIFDGYFSPMKTRVFLMVEKFLALFTDTIITVSPRLREEIVNTLRVVKASKCVVVSLGFNLDKFLTCEEKKGRFREELGITQGTLLIGIVGRLVPIKNHTMFLDVAKKIIDKKSSVHIKFVIIGDGELAGDLKKYVQEKGLEDDVIFAGWKKDLVSVYADLDVVALTSQNEGTPVSLIEAMACAKPVVSTDVGGVSDVVTHGENGFLVHSDDVEGFSDKIADLLMDREKRVLFGIRGRVAVKTKYSKDRLVNDIEALYVNCLKKYKEVNA